MARTVLNATTITNVAAAPRQSSTTAGMRASTVNNTRPSGGKIFPRDLISTSAVPNSRQYHIRLAFAEYKRYKDAVAGLQPVSDYIFLPIPNNLADTQSVVYTEEQMGIVAGLGVEMASGFQNDWLRAGGTAAGIFASNLPGTNIIDSKLVRYMTQSQGYALNPFLQVMMSGPAFKQFDFTWKFSPRDAAETRELRDIITMIRYNMLPGTFGNISLPASAPGWMQGLVNSYNNATSGRGALLSYPNVVLAQLFPTDQYLFKFKPMVIETMSINFTPSGSPSFFRDVTGAPVEVVLTLRLKEIEIWLKDHVS